MIQPSSAYLKHLKETDPQAFEKNKLIVQAKMLIDTGASSTVIGSNVVNNLSLKHHGIVSVSTPSSEAHEALTYDVDILIPIQNHPTHTVANIEVIESASLERQGIDGLIGRDTLSNMLLIYHGYTGEFTIAI